MKRASLVLCGLLATNAAQAQELRKLDYLPLIASGGLDIASTVYSPGREQNVLINKIKHEPTMLATGAALEVGAFTLLHKKFGKKHPKKVRAIILVTSAIHFFAASNNLGNR